MEDDEEILAEQKKLAEKEGGTTESATDVYIFAHAPISIDSARKVYRMENDGTEPSTNELLATLVTLRAVYTGMSLQALQTLKNRDLEEK